MKKEIIEKVIMNIHMFKYHHKESTLDEFDVMIFNEIMSSSYYDTEYKLIPICRKNYTDVHYKIENTYYDVFVYQGEEINYSNLYQLVLCDNYAEILKFPQNNYDAKKYVSRFSMLTHKIHSFYDGSLIIVETDEGRSDIPYEDLGAGIF